VVNLASRLESMTKQFRVSILTDEVVGGYVADHRSEGFARVRRLARVEPAGMSVPLVIHELLPTVGPDSLPEQKRLDFESAYEAMFEKKRWSDASAKLRAMSNDGPSDFLQKFMDKYPQGPSPDWDGIIELEKK
jgi:adenylate cyclase